MKSSLSIIHCVVDERLLSASVIACFLLQRVTKEVGCLLLSYISGHCHAAAMRVNAKFLERTCQQVTLVAKKADGDNRFEMCLSLRLNEIQKC